MQPENRTLRNQYGKTVCKLTKAEGESLVSQGRAVRTGPAIYRLVEAADPSKSTESPCMLTRGDMAALAGLQKVTEERRERLIGWGLLPDPTHNLQMA